MGIKGLVRCAGLNRAMATVMVAEEDQGRVTVSNRNRVLRLKRVHLVSISDYDFRHEQVAGNAQLTNV